METQVCQLQPHYSDHCILPPPGIDVVGEARQNSSYWKEVKESRAGGMNMNLLMGQEPVATLPQA